MNDQGEGEADGSMVGSRWPELLLALLLMAVAVMS